MSVNEVLQTFANHTTMHGVPKVIHSRSTLARCFWALVCLFAGTMFCIQMSEVLRRYFSYPKKVTVEVIPTPVPFPAISLCNMRNLDFHTINIINTKFLRDPIPMNHINDSDSQFVSEYMKTVAKFSALWYKYQAEYPLIFQEVFSRTTFSSNIPESIVSEAAVQLGEFVVNCFYGGNKCDIERDTVKFFDPYYYNCFTFTTPEHRQSGQETTMSLAEGIENGWSAIFLTGSGMLTANEEIRVLPGLHESKSAVSGSEGVRVVVHPPGTQPFPFTEGYDVPPGFSASFGIRPRRSQRVGPPYGNCTSENPFGKTTNVYRSISCQKMCLQYHVVRECGCFDASLPLPSNMSNDKLKSCRRNDEFPDDCMHNATADCLDTLLRINERIQCARRTRDYVTRETSILSACKCFPSCDEVLYDVSYSLSKWPAAGYEGDAAYFDVFYIEFFKERFRNTSKFNTVETFFNDSHRVRSMNQFARLNVYVADSNVITTRESPDYETNQLVSDIGGQLGLWVGISIITLTEVMELFIRLFRFIFSAKLSHQEVPRPYTKPKVTHNGEYVEPVDQPPRHSPEYIDPYHEANRYSHVGESHNNPPRLLTYSDPVYNPR